MSTRFAFRGPSGVSLRSLGATLALSAGILVLLATTAVALAGYVSAQRVLQSQINERLQSTSRQTLASIDAYVGDRVEELRAMVFGQLQIPHLSAQQRNITLYNYFNAFGSARYADLSIVDAAGTVVASTGAPKLDGSDAGIRALLDDPKAGVSSFLAFADREAPLLVVHAPLIDENGKRTGTLLGRLLPTELSRIVHGVPLEAGSELELLAGGKTIDTARADGAAPLDPRGAIAMTSSDPQSAGHAAFAVAARIDARRAFAPVRLLAMRSALSGAAVFLAAALLALYMARRIARPVRGVALAARALAAGDLESIVSTPRGAPDELRELGASFNTMSGRMRALIDGIGSASIAIRHGVAGSLDTVRAVDSGSEEQQQVVRRIAELLARLAGDARATAAESSRLEVQSDAGRAQLNDMVRELHVTMEALTSLSVVIEQSNAAGRTLSAQANEVAQRARSASDQADSATGLAAQGEAAVQRMVGDMQVVGESLLATVQRLKDLARSTGEAIHGQLGVVNDMAERSKLLALNAAIEAARAGDAGRGFGVIASELHKLASHSQQASAEVSQLVSTVLAETETVAREAQGATDAALLAIERAQATGATFETLMSEIAHGFGTVRDIGAIAADQAHRTHEIERATQTLDEMAVVTTQALQRVGELSREVRTGIDLANAVALSVSRAAQEQLTGFAVIERSVSEIQQTTQGVASVAESSLASTERLQREVEALGKHLEQFKSATGNTAGRIVQLAPMRHAEVETVA